MAHPLPPNGIRPLVVRTVDSDFDMRKRRWYLRELVATDRRGVYILQRKSEPVEPAEVHAVFTRDNSLASIMQHFEVRSPKAMKILEVYDIPFRLLLRKEWEAGATLAQLRERHGVGKQTLSRWLRDTGSKVRSGRKIPEMPADQVRRLWIAHRSINHVAKAFGVHWNTAQKRLKQLGLS